MPRIRRSGFPLTVACVAAGTSVLLLMLASGCGRPTAPVNRLPVTLRIGLGLTAGATGVERALDQAVRNIALEGLASLRRDGRIVPRLAEQWSVSQDRLAWLIRLRPSAAFHDGQPVNARAIASQLITGLPQTLGPAFDDILGIHA